MGHELHERDTMFSAIERPWHYEENKDKIVITDAVQDSAGALHNGGLDYLVESKPVFVNGIEVQGYKANVVGDDVLGIVSDRYRIVQNVEAFSFVDNILNNSEGIPVKYETAGSLFNRRKVWMLARLPDKDILGDAHENYLFFTNGHDGKNAIQVGITSTRIVCNNTLQAAISGAPRIWTTKHMGDIEAKKHEAIRTLQLASNYLDALPEFAERMRLKKLSDDAFIAFAEEIFPLDDNASELQEKRICAFRSNFIDLYNEKPDIENFRGTAYGAYLALTDYVSHVEPLRLTKTFKENRWAQFMDGHKLLQNGQRILEAVGV